MLDADEPSPALKAAPCSGTQLGFTIQVAGGKADGACRAALLGVVEMTPGIKNGFPPVPMHARAHTQDGLTPAEEMSHVSVAMSTVPATPCSSAPASCTRCGMFSQARPEAISGNVEMHSQIFWAPTWVVEERAGALALASLTQQPFPAAHFPREVCLAVGNEAAQLEESRYSLSVLCSIQGQTASLAEFQSLNKP